MKKLTIIATIAAWLFFAYLVYSNISTYLNLPVVQKSYTTKAGTCFWEDSLVKRPEGV